MTSSHLSRNEPTPAMVVAAARALCRDHAEVCNVNYYDLWMQDPEPFRRMARVALDAAGVPVDAATLNPEYTQRLIAALQENGDPVSVDAADEFQRLLDAIGKTESQA